MNTNKKHPRTALWTGAVLALAILTACVMPAQAAYVADKATSTARAAVMRLCTRFCGCHHHHHGHVWCGGHEDFWCPGHH